MTNSIKNKVKESPVTAEKVGEVVKEVAKQRVKITQRIYLGPNILGLPTYTVVETEFPQHIKGFIKDCPEIEKLFVPINEMAKVEKRVKEKGTLEHRWYQKVKDYKNGKRKEGDK